MMFQSLFGPQFSGDWGGDWTTTAFGRKKFACIDALASGDFAFTNKSHRRVITAHAKTANYAFVRL